MVTSVIRAALRDVRSDEDEEWFDERNWDPTRLALSSLTGPFQGIPVVGDMIESRIFQLFGEFQPEGNLFSGTERAVESASNIPN